MAIDTVATNALMIVRIRVKMEKAFEAKDIRERILDGEQELQTGQLKGLV